MQPLRILFVAPQFDYGDPARGPSFEEQTFRVSLEHMGHEVLPFDCLDRAQAVGREAMNLELDRKVREVSPDLVFCFLFGTEIEPRTIARLTADGFTTFNWFADDHWRLERFSRHYAPSFTYVATTDPSAPARYRKYGIDNVLLTQWAYSPPSRLEQPAKVSPSTIVFVGQRYGSRDRIVNRLRAQGLEVECWGFGWPNGRVTPGQMHQIFGGAKVNLNFSASYVSRWKPWVRPTRQIKARTFEVPGAGGFLLTQAAPRLDELFNIGEEIDVFDSEPELFDKASLWLSDDDARHRAATAAKARVQRDHTYANRFEQIFKRLGLT